MAVTQDGKISINVASLLKDALDLSTVKDELLYNLAITLGNGTGANQANQVFHDQRTVAASSNEDLDLAGALTNAVGDTITFTKVKAVIIKAAAGNTNNVQVTRPASNGVPLFMAAGDGIALTPGAVFVAVFPDANGVAVTADTGDLINVANSSSGSGVTYDVIIIGVG